MDTKELIRKIWPQKLDAFLAGVIIVALLMLPALHTAMTFKATTPSEWFQGTFMWRK